MIENQLRDSDRSRRWSKEVIDHSRSSKNEEVIREWLEKWMPLASAAIAAYCEVLPEPSRAAEAALSNIENFHKTLWLN
jgi:toluene monooxygenase system protein E